MQALDPRTVVLESEDAAEYQQVLSDYRSLFTPRGILEQELVHDIASLRWRIRRCVGLETAALETASQAEPANFLEAVAGKDAPLRFLSRYESSLRRAHQNSIKELRKIQAFRSEFPQTEIPETPPQGKMPNEPLDHFDVYARTFREPAERTEVRHPPSPPPSKRTKDPDRILRSPESRTSGTRTL